ncbi:MAG: hypothetical protein IKS77_02460, partial [Spirochaetales bacterium]|nr:hypothetical protein [Spirochaetales bacterium]
SEKLGAVTAEKDNALRKADLVEQNAQKQIKNLTGAFQTRLQKVQTIVESMQAQNTGLQQTVEGKNDQIRQIIARYNDAVRELEKRQNMITELRDKLSGENQKQMERELKINSLNGELVRRDFYLSQRENEILALKDQISELENRLTYEQ